MFAADKVGDPMTTALDPKDGKAWFGVMPPDLSLVARSRGADWLYTYLRGFYRDPAAKSGWNNTVFPNVGMPHVLWEYQGSQVLQRRGQGRARSSSSTTPGKLPPAEYDKYVGRPGELPRLHGRAGPGQARPDRHRGACSSWRSSS